MDPPPNINHILDKTPFIIWSPNDLTFKKRSYDGSLLKSFLGKFLNLEPIDWRND